VSLFFQIGFADRSGRAAGTLPIISGRVCRPPASEPCASDRAATRAGRGIRLRRSYAEDGVVVTDRKSKLAALDTEVASPRPAASGRPVRSDRLPLGTSACREHFGLLGNSRHGNRHYDTSAREVVGAGYAVFSAPVQSQVLHFHRD